MVRLYSIGNFYYLGLRSPFPFGKGAGGLGPTRAAIKPVGSGWLNAFLPKRHRDDVAGKKRESKVPELFNSGTFQIRFR